MTCSGFFGDMSAKEKVCTDELVSISDSEHAARVTRLEAEIAKRDGWIHSQQGRAQKRRPAYDNKIAMLETGVAKRDEALQHARVQESCLRAPVRSSADSVVPMLISSVVLPPDSNLVQTQLGTADVSPQRLSAREPIRKAPLPTGVTMFSALSPYTRPNVERSGALANLGVLHLRMLLSQVR